VGGYISDGASEPSERVHTNKGVHGTSMEGVMSNVKGKIGSYK
jgi:hypothetical protein